MKMKFAFKSMIFSAILGMSFIACSSDDDNNDMSENSKLVGTWKFSKIETNVEAEDSITQKQIEEYLLKDNTLTEASYVFSPDGTSKYKEGDDFSATIEYSLKGDKVFFGNAEESNLLYTDSTLVSISDMKKHVSKELNIDTLKITKAEKKDIFESILR